MIDVFAALALSEAAAKLEGGAGTLYSDARTLYAAYQQIKDNKTTLKDLANSPDFKTIVASANRVTAVANALVNDPAQAKHIGALLASL